MKTTLIGNGGSSFSDLDPRLDLNKGRIRDASVCNDGGIQILKWIVHGMGLNGQACGHLSGGACENCKDRLSRINNARHG